MKPSCRAAVWSRQPAISTWPRRPSAGRHAVPVDERQQRMARTSRAVRIERAGVGQGRLLGLGNRRGIRPDRPRAGEERAVRLLRRMAEVSLEAVQQDRGPALDERERVAPQPQRDAERRGTRRAAGSVVRAEGRASCAALRCRSRRAARRASRRAARRRVAAPRCARPTAARRTSPRPSAPAAATSARTRARRPGSIRNTCRNGERTRRSSDSGS